MAERAGQGGGRADGPKSHVRIFISSPGDVAEERRIAERVIWNELAKDPLLRDRVTFEVVSWDDPDAPMTMTANLTPQEAIERFGRKPSECQIVVVILWSRLGTHLDVRKYRKANGDPYLSGTEWEYEDALGANPQPDILVYRRTESPSLNNESEKAQSGLVNCFFERFRNPDDSFAGSVVNYPEPNAFGERLRRDLRSILNVQLAAAASITGSRLDGKIRVPRKPHLIGREGDLARVHEALNSGHTAITPAITGQGGIGKTQLAVLYAHEHAKDYPGGAFWLDAATPDRLIRGMSGYATELGLHDIAPQGDQEEFLRQSALRWIGEIRQRSDVLVVLDNVEEPSVLSSQLIDHTRVVDLGCRVLVTSRRRDLPGCSDLPLDVLSAEDARALLLEESGRKPETADEQEAADRIGRLLGRLPLAVRLAAARLRGAKGSLGDYVAWLEQRGAIDVLDDRKATVGDYEKGLKIVLAETWDSLPEDPPEPKQVMLAMGCLGEGEVIPHRVLRLLLGLPAEAAPFGDPLEEAVEDLYQRSILERPAEDAVRLHPLVHGIAARHGARVRDTFAETAAATLHRADIWAGKTGEDILDVLSDLSVIRPLTIGESPAARSLSLLERAIDLQSHTLRAGFEPLPHLHRQSTLLEDDRLTQTLVTALAEDRRPWLRQVWTTHRLDPALRRVLVGHTGGVNGCAVSADGSTAVSASNDNTLRVWDVASGDCRAVLEGHTGWVEGCALSADGSTAVSASNDNTLRVWDVASGDCRAVLVGHTGRVRGCAVSADGSTAVSACWDNTLRVWDVASGDCRVVLEGHTDTVRGCAVSADGSTAVSASGDGTLRIWDMASGDCRAVLVGHAHGANGCAVSADGSTAVSASGDNTLRIWDMASGDCRAVLVGHTGGVNGCAVSADGSTAVSACWDRTLRVWDVASGDCRAVLEGHTDTVRGCAVSADGSTAVTASDDSTLRAWDVASGDYRAVLEGHTDGVLGCAVSADGSTAVTASDDSTLRVWDVASGDCRAVLVGHTGGVLSCAVSADGSTAVSACWDRTLRVWDVASGDCRAVLEGHTHGARGCAASADGSTAVSASNDDTLRVWDVASGDCRAVLVGHTDGVLGCAVSADGSTAVSASSDRTLRVWDLVSGGCRAVLEGHTGAVRGCALSGDGSTAVSASNDGTLRVWDVASGECRAMLEGHTDRVVGCAFSGNGSAAVSASGDGTLRVWDVASGECRAVLVVQGIACCAITTDGRRILVGDSAGHVHMLEWVQP